MNKNIIDTDNLQKIINKLNNKYKETMIMSEAVKYNESLTSWYLSHKDYLTNENNKEDKLTEEMISKFIERFKTEYNER